MLQHGNKTEHRGPEPNEKRMYAYTCNLPDRILRCDPTTRASLRTRGGSPTARLSRQGISARASGDVASTAAATARCWPGPRPCPAGVCPSWYDTTVLGEWMAEGEWRSGRRGPGWPRPLWGTKGGARGVRKKKSRSGVAPVGRGRRGSNRESGRSRPARGPK